MSFPRRFHPSTIKETPAKKKERKPKNEKTMLGSAPTQKAHRISRLPGRKYFQRYFFITPLFSQKPPKTASWTKVQAERSISKG